MKKRFELICISAIMFVVLGMYPFISASVLINEFTTDPQTDWDLSGGVGTSDEFIELFNSGDSDINISGWNISLLDSTPTGQILSGTIQAHGYFVILNPTGSQNNDGQLILRNESGIIIDLVTYGNFDDGTIDNNAPNGNANALNDECLARLPNGFDSNNDATDFSKTHCTYAVSNNFLTIENQSESACPIVLKNFSLFVDVSGTDVKQVMISYQNGNVSTTKNATILGGTTNTYTITISGAELTAGILSWHAIAEDNSGIVLESTERNVTIRQATVLMVDPELPNGMNGWYVTEPNFSLIADPTVIQSYFKWDNANVHLYTGPFNLDTLPDTPKESAGILELNYWSSFDSSCGNESLQTSLLHIDLTDPVIKNLKPVNNTMVKAHQLTISAAIDDVYQGNSNINLSSISLTLDGEIVPFEVFEHSGDVTVRYSPENITPFIHTVMVSAMDNAGRSSIVSWSFEVNNSANISTNMQIFAPENGMIYNSSRVPFNVTLDHDATALMYRDSERDGKTVFLCRNCMEYGFSKLKRRSFIDGVHTIVIEAVVEGEISRSENISFFIDSENPSIITVEPRRGFTNGIFKVNFVENNPLTLSLSIVLENQSSISLPIDINSSCTRVKNKYLCDVTTDLSSYDGQTIMYWFSLSDIAGNTDQSPKRTLVIDITVPVITSLTTEIDKARVHFLIGINETNFDSVHYVDLNEANPKEKSLCSKLKNGVCDKTKTFRRGEHTLMILAIDKGGNRVFENTSFTII